MAQLEFTSMGELIVFRVVIDLHVDHQRTVRKVLKRKEDPHRTAVYPTHRKALNALKRSGFWNEGFVEPVRVFPHRFENEPRSPWAWVRP